MKKNESPEVKVRPWKEVWLEKLANDPEIKSIMEEHWEDILEEMGIDLPNPWSHEHNDE